MTALTAFISEIINTFRQRQRRAAAIRELAGIDPRLLQDVGIERCDVAAIGEAMAICQMEEAQVASTTPVLKPRQLFVMAPTNRASAMA